MPVIVSESKNRLAKGAKSHFRVQYVGEPRKPCQEQGRITLNIDSSEQIPLFFSIAIWVNAFLYTVRYMLSMENSYHLLKHADQVFSYISGHFGDLAWFHGYLKSNHCGW